MTLKISISGVRGTVPDSLTPDICLDFARAFGSFVADRGTEAAPKVVVGTDPRASSEFIKGIVFSGLLSTGCRVIDLGVCPTPTVGIMVRKLKAAGGMVITASHNPLPWNGLKFIRNDGIFLNSQQAARLIRIFERKKFTKGINGSLVMNPCALDVHVKSILRLVNARAIRRQRFRVAVDSCNGAASVISLRLLKELGCRVKKVNCDLSRPFPHPPEPVAENLSELSALVKRSGADVGFAFDSDADRLAVISEHGKAIGEETTLALAVKFALGHTPNKKIVVTNLSTTRAIEDIAAAQGGRVIRTPIGEVHVAEQLRKVQGAIGGEGNGGVIYPKLGFNRDALVGLALILNLMADSGKKISELVSELPAYRMIKKKFECRDRSQAEAFIRKAKRIFKESDLILRDGVKAVLPSGWVHVRASNTEPVIRVIAEAEKEKEARRLIDQVLKPLH